MIITLSYLVGLIMGFIWCRYRRRVFLFPGDSRNYVESYRVEVYGSYAEIYKSGHLIRRSFKKVIS